MKRAILLGADNSVSIETYSKVTNIEWYVSPHRVVYERPIYKIKTNGGLLYLMVDDALGAFESDEEVLALYNEHASALLGEEVYGNSAVVKMTIYDPETDKCDKNGNDDADWLELTDEDINNVLGEIKYEI